MDRLSFLEPCGKVGYLPGGNVAEKDVMGYLEFIAWVTSCTDNKGQFMVRNYGLYANANRAPGAAPRPLFPIGFP